MKKIVGTVAWGMALIFSWQTVIAQTAGPTAGQSNTNELSGFQLNWDNDVWGARKTDRWYTNGIRGSWAYKGEVENPLSKSFVALAKTIHPSDSPRFDLIYSVGQLMYTPRKITVASPQIDERPWGGYLFFSLTGQSDANSQKSFASTELKVGVTGKYAFAEEAQKLVHIIINSPPPAGWHNQLTPRLGIQLSHSRLYRLGDQANGDRFGFQVGWGAATGTLRTNANLNAAMIVGDLDGTNSPLLIGNEGDFVAQDFAKRSQFDKLFGFVFLSLTGVGYNYFLEGPTPYGRANIGVKRSYNLIQLGISIPLQSWFPNCGCPRLVYSQSRKSAEFTRERPVFLATGVNDPVQRWGTFTFNWDR